EEEQAEGVVMTFRPREPRDLLPWLLSWGAAARVLVPDALRQQIATEAQAMAALYCHEPPASRNG
nr:WYL domain-containing protein [Chloroflexota bacterium]